MQVFIKSFGCSANQADSEVLAGCLIQAGYKLSVSEADADVLIFNTCAVKGPTENSVIDVLRHVPKEKKVIVAGCLPKISFDRLQREVRFDGAIGPAVGREIVNVVSRVWAGEKVIELDCLSDLPKLDLPRVKSNPVVSVVPISSGCLGSCAYCCVVHARGHLRSYIAKEILSRVQSDVAGGVKEFWFTGQDTACYGIDLCSNLAELLSSISKLPGDFKVRVGMMTPNVVTPMQDSLIEAFKSEKVFKFLHLPIQSGADETLKRMRRFYTVSDFKSIVDAFRIQFPELTLATDVIIGFPGETEEAFESTLKLLEEVNPDVVNVSKFFARPKTEAAKMQERIVEKEIKRRSAVASVVAKRVSFEQNKRWEGWVGDILVDERGKFEGSWVGRNFAYKPIVVKSNTDLLGRTLKVRIVEATSTYLKGNLFE